MELFHMGSYRKNQLLDPVKPQFPLLRSAEEHLVKRVVICLFYSAAGENILPPETVDGKALSEKPFFWYIQ